MPNFRIGVVKEVIEDGSAAQTLRVELEGAERRAVLFTRYVAPAAPGDRVVLNTTASDLGLGSGGEDFVVWNLSSDVHGSLSGGHLMKLRYTPIQTDVISVEAQESDHHAAMVSATSIEGMPVVAASLHSQLLPVVVALRSRRPLARIVYVMTDGAAIEAAYSKTLTRLRELGWLHSAITVGHAVGGDLEAVNVYSGLLAARHVAGADVAVVGMGPGVVGTGTSFGTTALELGTTINAAASLEGLPVAAVRMSSGDERVRHSGLSHHALTALTRVALVRAEVPVPAGHAEGLDEVARLHRVVEVDAEGVIQELERAGDLGLVASHMGRTPDSDRLFFLAAGAAGLHAAGFVQEG